MEAGGNRGVMPGLKLSKLGVDLRIRFSRMEIEWRDSSRWTGQVCCGAVRAVVADRAEVMLVELKGVAGKLADTKTHSLRESGAGECVGKTQRRGSCNSESNRKGA